MSARIERRRGPAGDLHGRPLPDPDALGDRPLVWVCEVDRPALVLGSRQPDDVVDQRACRAAGVEVVRRRSGGGLVYLAPGEVLWVDVVVPAGDRRGTDDVRASMIWIGELWAAALDAAAGGAAGAPLRVHRGGMQTSSWSELVCFAGVGPGEVLVGSATRTGDGLAGAEAVGDKLVGLSQRRTRTAARYQGAIHLHADPDVWLPLLADPRPPRAELPCVATLDPAAVEPVIAELARRL